MRRLRAWSRRFGAGVLDVFGVDVVLTSLIVRQFCDLLIIHNLFTLRVLTPRALKLRRALDCLIVYFFVSATAQLLFDLANPASASAWVVWIGTPVLVVLALMLIRANRGMSDFRVRKS